MFVNAAVIADIRELALDGAQRELPVHDELWMTLGQRQERAPATQTHLETGRGQPLHEPVARETGGTEFQHERQTPPHDVGRCWIEQPIDELAGCVRAERRQRRDDWPENLSPLEERDERADEQWVSRGRAQRRTDAIEVARTQLDDRGNDGIVEPIVTSSVRRCVRARAARMRGRARPCSGQL